MEWQKLTGDKGTYVLKVFEGWVIRYMIMGYPALVFVPDREHRWEIK